MFPCCFHVTLLLSMSAYVTILCDKIFFNLGEKEIALVFCYTML